MIKDYNVRITCDDSSGTHYYSTTQTDQVDDSLKCATHPTASVRDFVITGVSDASVTCVADSMDIVSNVGTDIVDDTYNATSDENDIKYFVALLLRDNTSGDLEIAVYTKIIGEYQSVPSTKTFIQTLNEFYTDADGTEVKLLLH